jgi:hypothetical protein
MLYWISWPQKSHVSYNLKSAFTCLGFPQISPPPQLQTSMENDDSSIALTNSECRQRHCCILCDMALPAPPHSLLLPYSPGSILSFTEQEAICVCPSLCLEYTSHISQSCLFFVLLDSVLSATFFGQLCQEHCSKYLTGWCSYHPVITDLSINV